MCLLCQCGFGTPSLALGWSTAPIAEAWGASRSVGFLVPKPRTFLASWTNWSLYPAPSVPTRLSPLTLHLMKKFWGHCCLYITSNSLLPYCAIFDWNSLEKYVPSSIRRYIKIYASYPFYILKSWICWHSRNSYQWITNILFFSLGQAMWQVGF